MLCFMIAGFCSNGDIFLISMHYTQQICLLKLNCFACSDSLFGGGSIGIVNNVFKLILLVTKLTLLSCCVLRL